MSAFGYTFREFAVPRYMAEGLDLWIQYGVLPGDFLTAVLSNDLMEACARADENNLANLPAYCAYLHNEAPPLCYGSRARMGEWIRLKAPVREAAFGKGRL